MANPLRYGAVLQLKNLLFNAVQWQGTAAGDGGNWMDEDGTPKIDSDAYRTAIVICKTQDAAIASLTDFMTEAFADRGTDWGTDWGLCPCASSERPARRSGHA